MGDDKKKVRGNKDEGSGNMPDPGSTLSKGPTDDVRANKDKGKKSGNDN